MVSKQGRERCCRRCAGRPPLSQCIHTNAGRDFLEHAQKAQENESETRRVDRISDQEKGPDSPSPQSNAPAIPLVTNNPSQLSIQRLLNHLTPQSPTRSLFSSQSAGPATPTRNQLECSHSPTTPSTPFSNGVPEHHADIGPDVTPMSSPMTEGISGGPSFTSETPSPLHSGSSGVSGIIRKKAKVTKKNPAWGYVTGAMRGSKKLEIIRPQPLRKRMGDHSSSTKRFHREVATLIGRAERLAEETGCWLALMAQHGNSGTSATHFTSSSLRRDAKEDAVSLINNFHSITRALLVAKRQGALEMAKKLVEAEESVVNVQTALASKEAALAEARALLAQHGITVPPVSD